MSIYNNIIYWTRGGNFVFFWNGLLLQNLRNDWNLLRVIIKILLIQLEMGKA